MVNLRLQQLELSNYQPVCPILTQYRQVPTWCHRGPVETPPLRVRVIRHHVGCEDDLHRVGPRVQDLRNQLKVALFGVLHLATAAIHQDGPVPIYYFDIVKS